MWSLIILLFCLAILLIFAIYKISRENKEASSSAYAPPPSPAPASLDEPKEIGQYDFINSVLEKHLFNDHAKQQHLHPDKMVPTSVIVAGVEQFKANYHGPDRERILGMLDQGLAELKSRFADQIPAHELREFIKAKGQELLSRHN
jgi:hypothetical protein